MGAVPTTPGGGPQGGWHHRRQRGRPGEELLALRPSGWTHGTRHSRVPCWETLLSSPHHTWVSPSLGEWQDPSSGPTRGPTSPALPTDLPFWPHQAACRNHTPIPPLGWLPSMAFHGQDVPRTTHATTTGCQPHTLLVREHLPGNRGPELLGPKGQAWRTMGAHQGRPLDGQEPTEAGPLATRPRHLIYRVASTPLS